MTSEFAIALPGSLPPETVHDKPVMGKDANGEFYWSTAAHALRHDEHGWHDRQLLTSADLTDRTNAKDAKE